MNTQTVESRIVVCEKHGEYESRNYLGSIWTKCPICADEAEAERLAEEAEAEKREKARAWQRKIGVAGIPERFQARTIEAYNADTNEKKVVKNFCVDYVQRFDEIINTGESVIFCGKPGTGKTHLAAGIGLELMKRNNTVLFSTVLRAIRRIKETWQRGSEETETQAINALVEVDLLILDEIGVQFGSETEKMILFDVLNDRYERMKPTILISNLTVSEVKDYLGERLFDRLRENNGSVQVFTWGSHRGKSS